MQQAEHCSRPSPVAPLVAVLSFPPKLPAEQVGTCGALPVERRTSAPDCCAWGRGFAGRTCWLAAHPSVCLGTVNTVTNGKLSLALLPEASQIKANASQAGAI